MKQDYNISLLVKAAALLWVTQSFASTIITPAGLLTNALENAISKHLQNGGRVEEITATKLAPLLNLEALTKVSKGDLWSRLQMVADTKVQAPDSKNRILAVTSFQILEDRRAGAGRYVVWMNAKNPPPAWESLIWTSWETQEKVDSIFRSSGVVLQDKGVWKQPNTKNLEGMREESKTSPDSPQLDGAKTLEVKSSIDQLHTIAPSSVNNMEVKSPSLVKPSSEEPTSSMPWSIIVVLIVAACGLLWLLVKNRK